MNKAQGFGGSGGDGEGIFLWSFSNFKSRSFVHKGVLREKKKKGMGILSGVCVILISVHLHGRGWLARLCRERKVESIYDETAAAN